MGINEGTYCSVSVSRLPVSAFLSSVFDQLGIDGILVDGLPRLFSRLSTTLRGGQSGYIRNYAWVFFFGVIVLVGYFAIR